MLFVLSLLITLECFVSLSSIREAAHSLVVTTGEGGSTLRGHKRQNFQPVPLIPLLAVNTVYMHVILQFLSLTNIMHLLRIIQILTTSSLTAFLQKHPEGFLMVYQ